jgi:hypothetical protein
MISIDFNSFLLNSWCLHRTDSYCFTKRDLFNVTISTKVRTLYGTVLSIPLNAHGTISRRRTDCKGRLSESFHQHFLTSPRQEITD